jgi:hypothetical protein
VARFQIRDDDFGLALVEAEDAREALLDFLASQRRSELRGDVILDEDGAAGISLAGTSGWETFRAVPLD